MSMASFQGKKNISRHAAHQNGQIIDSIGTI